MQAESVYIDAEIGASNFITAGTSIRSIAFLLNATTTTVLPVTISSI
jgi:hypothetical protein